MPKLLLIEQYFYPDGWGGAEIPRDIALGLREAGFEIDVLCSRDQYAPVPPADVSADPRASGIRILRAPRILPGRSIASSCCGSCGSACTRAHLLWHRDSDLIATQTNPPLIVPTVALVAALPRAFHHRSQDLYPEVLFASGLPPGRARSGGDVWRDFLPGRTGVRTGS